MGIVAVCSQLRFGGWSMSMFPCLRKNTAVLPAATSPGSNVFVFSSHVRAVRWSESELVSPVQIWSSGRGWHRIGPVLFQPPPLGVGERPGPSNWVIFSELIQFQAIRTGETTSSCKLARIAPVASQCVDQLFSPG